MSNDTAPNYNARKMHSPTWNYFKRLSPGSAKCNLCKKKLSYKTSITNLKRHLLLKHKVNLGYNITKTFNPFNHPVNVRKLISLVKQHPCLWDDRSMFFRSSEKRYESWKEIASILWPEIDPGVAVGTLSNRFSSLKEQFFAEKGRAENDEQNRKSAYYNDLKFLEQEVIDVSSASSLQGDMEPVHMDIFEINEIDVKNEPIDEESQNVERNSLKTGNGHEDPPPRWANENKIVLLNGLSKQTKTIDAKPKDERKSPQNSLTLNVADRDVLFLLSLSTEMKRVPKDIKTDFKSEVMMTISGLIQKYRQSSGDDSVQER